MGFESALLAAAYLVPDQTLPGVEPLCSTGDCEWPIYGSLGICADVVNLTDTSNTTLRELLEYYVLWALRDSQFATMVSSLSNVLLYPALLIPFPAPSYQFNESVTRAAIGETLLAFSSTLVNITDNTVIPNFQFLDIMLYFCTKSFSSSVKAGISNTFEVASTLNILPPDSGSFNWAWNLNYGSALCPSTMNGLSMLLSGAEGFTNETYTVDYCTAYLASNLYTLSVSGGILLSQELSTTEVYGQIETAIGVSLFGDFLSKNTYDSETQFQNIKGMADNIAASLTN
jgi:hypothetical protein